MKLSSLFVLPLLLPGMAAAALTEGFDNIGTLAGAGWVLTNNSVPVGTPSWFQGNTAVFPSQSGAPDSYIAGNFNAAGFPGDISLWLILPNMTLNNGDVLSFFTRTENPQIAIDKLEVRMSQNGASTNVGANATSVGDFTSLLLTINPGFTLAGYPAAWTQFNAVVSGLGGPTSGRLAFRYVVPDTTTNADYIGIDTVSVGSVPEPSTVFLSLLGFASLALFRRKN